MRKAAAEFLGKEERLDVLFNLGCVVYCKGDLCMRADREMMSIVYRATMYLTAAEGHLNLTEDGYDTQWGTNVVGAYQPRPMFLSSFLYLLDCTSTGPYLFTKLLLPALFAGAAASLNGKARVSFTASQAQATEIKYDTLTDTEARKKFPPGQRYAQSKFVSDYFSCNLEG